jgi:hypothetical protein
MCMASHKSLSINDPVKSTPSYVRQSLSATRVISLLTAELPEHLPPLPLVPYALSVALSVVYRHFRQRRLKVHINRATEELKQCVVLLNRLRNAWWSAGTMADLGTAVLNNADRNTRAVNTPANIPDLPHPRSHPHPGQNQYKEKFEPPTQTPQLSHTHSPAQWQIDTSIDPRLQSQPQTPMTSLPSLLNSLPASTPGQHPTSSERGDRAAPPMQSFDFSEASPDWLNFDAAFENFEGLLGSSGADLSNELFRPLNYDLEGFMEGVN